ncbi:hypothetical protein ABT237_11825 [Streptomyces sp. NPDC001581]|uniref:type IV toxin-antitoxin system AbiEi family antitoxin domain-containing protein n=1 Tax=Streptomyces sp. NPDC001581 TaxID=3154386 RepID=UPI00331F4FD9
MLELIARIATLSEGQCGHVTEAQAAAVGASPDDIARLSAVRVTEPVVPGVFRLRGGGRHPFPRLFAQWLLLEPESKGWERQNGESGVVSHRSALRVHGLGDWPGPSAEFTLPTGPSRTSAADIALHTQAGGLAPGEWQTIAGLPVTTPGRTLCDLALSPHAEPDAIARVASAIIRRGLASREDLATALNRFDPPVGGSKRLDDLLALHDGDI